MKTFYFSFLILEQNGNEKSPDIKLVDSEVTDLLTKIEVDTNDLKRDVIVDAANKVIRAQLQEIWFDDVKVRKWFLWKKKELDSSDFDLDKRRHRKALATWMTGLNTSEFNESKKTAYNALIWLIKDLNEAEDEYDKKLLKEEGYTKKQIRAIRKAIRKDINMDHKIGFMEKIINLPILSTASEDDNAEQNKKNELEKKKALNKKNWKSDFEKNINTMLPVQSDLEYVANSVNVELDDAWEISWYIANLQKWDVKLTWVEFDKSMKLTSTKVTGSDGQEYSLSADKEGKISVEVKTEVPTPEDQGGEDEDVKKKDKEAEEQEVKMNVDVNELKPYVGPGKWIGKDVTWKVDAWVWALQWYLAKLVAAFPNEFKELWEYITKNKEMLSDQRFGVITNKAVKLAQKVFQKTVSDLRVDWWWGVLTQTAAEKRIAAQSEMVWAKVPADKEEANAVHGGNTDTDIEKKDNTSEGDGALASKENEPKKWVSSVAKANEADKKQATSSVATGNAETKMQTETKETAWVDLTKINYFIEQVVDVSWKDIGFTLRNPNKKDENSPTDKSFVVTKTEWWIMYVFNFTLVDDKWLCNWSKENADVVAREWKKHTIYLNNKWPYNARFEYPKWVIEKNNNTPGDGATNINSPSSGNPINLTTDKQNVNTDWLENWYKNYFIINKAKWFEGYNLKIQNIKTNSLDLIVSNWVSEKKFANMIIKSDWWLKINEQNLLWIRIGYSKVLTIDNKNIVVDLEYNQNQWKRILDIKDIY